MAQSDGTPTRGVVVSRETPGSWLRAASHGAPFHVKRRTATWGSRYPCRLILGMETQPQPALPMQGAPATSGGYRAGAVCRLECPLPT
jgi:hypothetical protein